MNEILTQGALMLPLLVFAAVGMARVDAGEYAEKWARRLSASSQDIRKGIEKVKVSPTAKAADQAELALRKIMEAFNNGTWASQLRKVSLESWRASAIGKGLDRIAKGVADATPGQVQMATKLLAAVDLSVAEANRTPRGSLEDNITRMTTFVRGMAGRSLKKPGA
jgi:hypothetical protein